MEKIRNFSLKKAIVFYVTGASSVITELIRRIRKTIGNYSDTEYIETVWGMGYKWKK